MLIFEIYNGETLVNIIVAESKELAEQLTGLTAVRSMPSQPYKGWVFNDLKQMWEAPSPQPEDGLNYIWDEQSLSWVEIFDLTEEEIVAE